MLDSGARQLDEYLNEVRGALAALSATDIDETLRELRSHVLDRAGSDLPADGVAAALAALGEPAILARMNALAILASEGAARRTPWGVLNFIGRVARLSLGGMLALLVSVSGYGLAAAWIIAAVVKPFAPGQVGLWVPETHAWAKTDLKPGPTHDPHAYSLVLGVSKTYPHGQELLGWWIIPIGLILGVLTGWLTYRYGRWSLRRLARRPARIDA